MNYWLVKSDPDEYSAAHLERDGETSWTGVSNPLARKHLRAMRKGDAVLLYHTGKEKAVVAIAHVARAIPAGAPPADDAVQLQFSRWLANPVPLAAIKADPAFADFTLVRIGRLSVMPVSQAHWKRILRVAADPAAGK